MLRVPPLRQRRAVIADRRCEVDECGRRAASTDFLRLAADADQVANDKPQPII